MDEKSTTTGPNPNNPTVPYVPSAKQRDSAGGSALANTLSRNRGEGFRSFDRTNATYDKKTKDSKEREDMARQMHRNWNTGDAYAPHDLSYQEQKKWIKPRQPTKDVIDMLGLNPLDHYKVRGNGAGGGGEARALECRLANADCEHVKTRRRHWLGRGRRLVYICHPVWLDLR